MAYQNPGFWSEYSGRYPLQWGNFHAWLDECGVQMAATELALWARYAARFKAASAFRGIKFSGLGEKTERGYSAALGVFLSYSVLEACWAASGQTLRQRKIIGINDVLLARRIRASLKSAANVIGGLNNGPLIKATESFMRDESDDVLTVARALRHLVAHGIFTPWGYGAVSLKAARTLNDLAEVVLSYSEQIFREHFRNLRTKQ